MLSFPFTDIHRFEETSEEMMIKVAGYNETVPACPPGVFSVDCSRCILSTLSNDSATFTCNAMDTVFPPYSQVINGKDNGRRLTNTSSDSNSFLNYSCIEIGYSFQTNLI
jgi:hypothetical protein